MQIGEKVKALFDKELLSGIKLREDSRAFGAMVEKRITENWGDICKDLGYEPEEIPGRRSIFDFACKIEDHHFGFDVKTKDLYTLSYSDGGVCAVGNLLNYMANKRGIFMIVEFGHNKSGAENDERKIEYIKVAPFHVLPLDTYRIENLGTGQVRLNKTIEGVWNKIDWYRSHPEFFEIFCDLALTHYRRVIDDAEKRIQSISTFEKSKYERFKFIK